MRRLLRTTPLLTLVGTGGVGKTRLALQAAREFVDENLDGVQLVDLAPVADSASVARAVAAAYGIPERTEHSAMSVLLGAFGTRRLLLVLDNCEHVVQGCAELTEALLRACPHLTILATSRELLGVAGETIWRVPSMTVPDAECASSAALAASESVQLFAERARLAQADYVVNDASAAVTAELCRRLDGIPLAIELAAARLRGMTVEQIAARLDDRFRILTGGARTALPRQHTLRGAVDWSYELLLENERVVLRRLAVFAGGFGSEAADAVCAGQPVDASEVFELLLRLVDKSLVHVESQSTATRYRLLETIRQYALERLVEAHEEASTRVRHRDWCLALAEAAWPNLITAGQRLWLERLYQEHDNMRAALSWSLEDPLGAEPAVRLAGALHRFWWRHGHISEGRMWLTRALERAPRQAPAAGIERCQLRAILGAGILARAQGDYAEARSCFEASLVLAREVGDRVTVADATFRLASVLFEQGEERRAVELTEQSLALWRQIGDPWGMSWPLASLATWSRRRGDYAQATELQEERLALARQSGDPWNIAGAMGNLGILAYEQGQHERAAQLLESSRDTFQALGDRESVAWTLRHMGLAAVDRGDRAEAVRRLHESLTLFYEVRALWGVADCLDGIAIGARDGAQAERSAMLLAGAAALRGRLGYPLAPPDAVQAKQEKSRVRAILGARRFVAAWEAGERLSVERAIALAAPTVPDTADAPLTRRGVAPFRRTG